MNTTQQRLLATGFEIARRQGLRALTVRGLAQQAGVNPGSFVYHFGTREHFIEVLIERWYGPLFEQMQLNAREGGSPRARLGALIAHLLDSVLEQGDFVGQLFMDAAAGAPAVRRVVTSLGERHIRLLLDVVADRFRFSNAEKVRVVEALEAALKRGGGGWEYLAAHPGS